ncbi:ester cyclase [Mycobacterium sp. GA-2829]|uniref:ester cyclase n=1 Tax=Mycobacterium sp. GA-2829 TaxID=1772283 RepID=UPI00073FDF99|nr:ester cyclase [Mycobacterium sp. GA-2829]KUI40185.1 hypothetical protein AU194_11960 [Mycobacterium sp. GA-2829]
MTAIETTTSLRQQRETTVRAHIEAENRHDIEATIATFHRPRYEVNGEPSDGEEAVRELLRSLMHALPDLHAETTTMRHLDDGVLVEGLITGTHDGEWAGVPPSGNHVRVPMVAIFEFDGGQLLCEKAYLDMAMVLAQMGAFPAV